MKCELCSVRPRNASIGVEIQKGDKIQSFLVCHVHRTELQAYSVAEEYTFQSLPIDTILTERKAKR